VGRSAALAWIAFRFFDRKMRVPILIFLLAQQHF